MITTAPITIQGDLLNIRFANYGLDAYAVFLQSKRLPESRLIYDARANAYTLTAPARFASLFGVQPNAFDAGWLPPAQHLHDYQRWIVYNLALPTKRFAVWADTGLGKTIMFLEWARQVVHRTGGRVLIVSPLNIIPQTLEEAARWYGEGLPVAVLDTQKELAAWCVSGSGIAITNYEKFIPEDGKDLIPEVMRCAGVVLDESSRLKTGGGVIKWSLVKSCKGVEYKLSGPSRFTLAVNQAILA